VRLLAWAALASLLGTLGACRTVPATQVLVFFHAEPATLVGAADLEILVYPPDAREPLSFVEPVAAGGVAALARVPLVPAEGDASRRFRIVGALRDADGLELTRVSANVGYVQHELREVHLWLDADCAGVDCGEGRTCQRGVCLGDCFEPAPAGAERSQASCGECQACTAGACTSLAVGSSCGCPGDQCDLEGNCTNATRVQNVFAGYGHTCAEVDRRGLFCWGTNEAGRTAVPTSGSPAPVPVSAPSPVTGAAGQAHTCILDQQRVRTCFGWNGEGQIGNGDAAPAIEPPASFAEPTLSGLSAGVDFTCGIGAGGALDGRVVCWGNNVHGIFGENPDPTNPISVRVPTEIDLGGARATQVSANGYHACTVREDGHLFCWGYNNSSEVGTGATGPGDVFAPVETACLDAACDGWETVAAGTFHTCALREDGSLWCWGGNLNAQLGRVTAEMNRPEPLEVEGGPYVAVAAGRAHTCALDEGGRVLCWGQNDSGQVGIGSTTNATAPTPIETAEDVAFRRLALGHEHSCAVRADASLWCWGLNEELQLGLGDDVTAPFVTRPRRVCFPPR
jgi:alpha-tubulin suppressor-like RCC1 family protein